MIASDSFKSNQNKMVSTLTVLKMIAPSPSALPGVPTLADLQKRAEELTASLPSYSSATDSNEPAQSRLNTTGGTTKTVSKPIPRVNIHPDPSTCSLPLAIPAPAPGQGESRSWLSSVGLPLWASPPPTYRAQDPLAPNTSQLREEMEMDRRAEEDQGRARLISMGRMRNEGVVQAGLPGEEGQRDRWGRASGKRRE